MLLLLFWYCRLSPSFCKLYHFLFLDLPSVKKQNVLDRYKFCQGRIKTYPRCHLDSSLSFAGEALRLYGIPTYPRQLTCVCTSQNTRKDSLSFDCALNGPFVRRYLARFSASRALCIVLCLTLSPHQRFTLNIIPPKMRCVKGFQKSFIKSFRKDEFMWQSVRVIISFCVF